MRIGIDVGGTNTDAVLMHGRRVLAEAKTPTTADVTGGISSALRGLVADGAVGLPDVQAMMIGTTHFTNALIEAKGLLPTAAVRLGLPAARALPPMVDWPERLRQALGGTSICVTAATSSTGACSRRWTLTSCGEWPPTSPRNGCARSRSPRCSRRSTPSVSSRRRRS